jgi:transposase
LPLSTREVAMARFKPYDYSQMKLVPVSFKEQILPGTFEYTLNHLIDHEIDFSVFEHRYCNDETGAPAYDPAILLKITQKHQRGQVLKYQLSELC